MPWVAIVNGERKWAIDTEEPRATCSDVNACGAVMYRRAGVGMAPHWSHAPGTADGCDAGQKMTPWHYDWQRLASIDRVEFTVGKRRADVLTRFSEGGQLLPPEKQWAIEFQHSNMRADRAHGREDDWRGRLIWVHDVTSSKSGDLRVTPDGNFNWLSPFTLVTNTRCHQIADYGADELLWLPPRPAMFITRGEIEGKGYLIDRQWFVDQWLNGEAPLVPRGLERSRWDWERKNPAAAVAKRKTPQARTKAEIRAMQAAMEDENYICPSAGKYERPERPCIECGQPLLLLLPGRVQCERCRLAAKHAAEAGVA